MTDARDRFGRALEDAAAGRLAGLLEQTLAGEPPLADLVPAALAGARRRQRRERVALAVAPVLVAALGVAGYTLVPRSSHGADHSPSAAATTPASPDPTVSDQPLPLDSVSAELCAGIHADPSPNVVPANSAQAARLCAMTFDTLHAVFPDADLSFSAGVATVWGENNQIDIVTPRGTATLSLLYLWPANDKGEYPQVTDTSCPAGSSGSCFETTPGPRLRGMLTVSDGGQDGYMVDDTQGGRWIIGLADRQQIGPAAPPYTPDQYRRAFLDPRFGAYLREYADYVLANSPMKWPAGATYKGHLG